MQEQTSYRISHGYLWAVPSLGGAALVLSTWELAWSPPPVYWLLLTAFATLVSSYTIRIPGSVVKLSISEPLVFLSSLLYGPAAGTVTASIDAVVLSLRLKPQLRTVHRIAFNVGALALSVWPSSHLYFWLTGLDQHAPQYGNLDTFVLPVYAFAATVFFLNTALVAFAVAIEKHVSALRVWRGQFATFAASYLASAAIAAILVVLVTAGDAALLALLLPLILVSVLTVRTTLGRLNDEHQHLIEVNRLHLSTIETLAMAIDAKDQVTHGHIRRVQRLAVALARSLGVHDDRQLRAIEAAALLHDMGKLAIPEFILNKPGRLTPREFEVMKTHAAIGADLLSSIQFPYPVVPIVRHHHENWDGTGYPDGLRGAEIPVGARILSVVDCYDALTSHRPYRPALTTTDALEILAQRRGKMYDPLVVDVFVREHAALTAEAEPTAIPDTILSPQPEVVSTEGHALYATPGYGAVKVLEALAALSPFPSGPSITTWCRQLSESLRSIGSFDAMVLFVPDDQSSDLIARWADADFPQSSSPLRMPIAERLSGWVAAHRTAVWNSDASLDLPEVSTAMKYQLASSIPLCVGDSLVAVVTLYGSEGDGISAEQRHAIESLVPAVADSLLPVLAHPCNGIDCSQAPVKSAAVSAVDVLLSHDRPRDSAAACAVAALSLTPISEAALGSEVVGVSELWHSLYAQDRFLLRLTDSHYLICAPGGVPAEVLESQTQAAMQRRHLLAFSLSVLPIASSLELQDALRRMMDRSTARRSGVRVH